jgi:hypothetical protein
MNEQNPNGLTKLERLAVLLRDDSVEPEAMDAQQLKTYLQELKENMSGPQKRFDAVLKKAKAQKRLERARERRLKAIELAKTVITSGAGAIDAARSRVGRMIGKLGEHDPDQAQVYAREFEQATAEDLATLEQDLALLEMETQEDEKSNPRDAR